MIFAFLCFLTLLLRGLLLLLLLRSGLAGGLIGNRALVLPDQLVLADIVLELLNLERELRDHLHELALAFSL